MHAKHTIFITLKKICSGLLLILGGALGLQSARADFKDDIGFTALKAEYGSALPSGTSVRMAQIEYTSSNSYWAPQATGDVASKTFNYVTSTFGGYSDHAYNVACYLGGSSTSITPNLPGWTCFEATNYCYQQSLMAGLSIAPQTATWDIENHSWGANDLIFGVNDVQRMDYRIERDNVIVVVGVDNTATLSMEMANAYNVISVGVTSGNHAHSGSTIEVIGREKPEIVAPASATSYATPMVSSCAALLVDQISNTPTLATARHPLVVKALLMAGATKDVFSSWTHTSTQPLDTYYGVGQVNIYNSYQMLVSGQQPSSLGVNLNLNGWDLNSTSTSSRKLYYFSVPSGKKLTLSAVLAWYRHLQVDSQWQNLVSVVNNLDLILWQADGAYNLQSQIAVSMSPIDNVEHIYQTSLSAGQYALEVTASVDSEKYGLAWRGALVDDGSSSSTSSSGTTSSSTTNAFSGAGFESPSVGTNTFSAFVYNPSGTAWTFSGNAGVAGNGSGFTSANAAAPEGTQVGFVQMTGSIDQNVTFTAGTYTIGAQAAQRAIYQLQTQTVNVYVDGTQVGTFNPSGTSYSSVSTSAFTVTAGVHDVKFVGTATQDATVFLDALTITAATASTSSSSSIVSITDSGFESPSVGTNTFAAFAYNPTGSAWTFTGGAGLAGNNSGFTDVNPCAPQGTQVAFLQGSSAVVAQTLSFATSGTYTMVVSAACRGDQWNAALQVVNVYIDSTLAGTFTPNSTSYQTYTLSFTASAGSHQLSFGGTVNADATAFLDDVSIIGP